MKTYGKKSWYQKLFQKKRMMILDEERALREAYPVEMY